MTPGERRPGEGSDEITEVEGGAPSKSPGRRGSEPGRAGSEPGAGDTMNDGGPIGNFDTEPVELITGTMEKIAPDDLLETNRRPIVRPPPASLQPAAAQHGSLVAGVRLAAGPQTGSLAAGPKIGSPETETQTGSPAAGTRTGSQQAGTKTGSQDAGGKPSGLLDTGTMRLPPPPSVEMAAMATLPSMTAAVDGTAAGAGTGDLAPGTILGDYTIESKIGRGGMGDVYLGVHRVIKKRAAIKLLRADYCRDETTVARFTSEARVVNEIGHPNIVDIFAFGQADDGRQYLVMEYLQGESLRARLTNRGPLDVEEVCAIARPLVRALRAAHSKGVIHRDLKPDNIFLLRSEAPGEPEVVKLLDFGLAKLQKPDPGIEDTAKGVLVGTPLYISPEQARGKPVDRKADVYTLGGVMFEMVTGRPPFVAPKTIDLITKHLIEPAPQPSMYAKGVPPELDDVIVRMLAKDPTQRPELVQVLDILDELADFGKAPTDEMQFSRDSIGSIAITEKRVPADEMAAQSSSGRAAFPAMKDRGSRRWVVWVIAAVIVAGIVTTIIGLSMT